MISPSGASVPAMPVTNNVVRLEGSGAPVDGTTGDNVAGPGSRYTDIVSGEWYTNIGLITNPTWKLMTRTA
jgi:hypothetical protein